MSKRKSKAPPNRHWPKEVGILVDPWKTPIFEKALAKGGWTYKKTQGKTNDGTDVPAGMVVYRVTVGNSNQLADLQRLCEKCQRQAAAIRSAT